MSEPKKTITTFTFEEMDDSRYLLNITGDLPDLEQTYILWVKIMEVLITMPGLNKEKRHFIQSVYNHIMSPAEKIASKSDKVPLRIVTVYKSPISQPTKPHFFAVEFHTLAGGAERTGWIAEGSYEKVTAAIRKAFGVLEKIARDPTDDPSVVENWI